MHAESRLTLDLEYKIYKLNFIRALISSSEDDSFSDHDREIIFVIQMI